MNADHSRLLTKEYPAPGESHQARYDPPLPSLALTAASHASCWAMPNLTSGQLEDFAPVSASRIWIRNAGHRTGTNQRVESTSMPNVR
jgi:hypothetical protein